MGTQLPLPKREHSFPIFGPLPLWPNGWMDQDALGMVVGLGPGYIVLDGDPAPLHKKNRMGTASQFSVNFYYGQTAGCIRIGYHLVRR